MAARLPAFRSRLVHPPLRLALPRWAELAELDLDWHLQRSTVSGPRAWEDVLDLARRKAVTVLDPARPLWEMTGRALFNEVFLDEARVPTRTSSTMSATGGGWPTPR